MLLQQYCCDSSHPCWGWGSEDGKCCADGNNGGCKGAVPCGPGGSPSDTAAQCQAVKDAATAQAAGTTQSTAATTSAASSSSAVSTAAANAQAAQQAAVAAQQAAAAAQAQAAQAQAQAQAAATSNNGAIPADLLAAYPTATPEQLAQLAAQEQAQNSIIAQQQAADAAVQAANQAQLQAQSKAQQAQQAASVAAQAQAQAQAAAQAQPQAAAQAQATAAAAAANGAKAQAAAVASSASSGGGGGGSWTNMKVNRFGDYTAFGQGQGWMGTVACTGKIAPPAGLWAAMNFQAFGLSSLPCGMGLTVTNPATGASVHVTVVDGGGSLGLDLDNQAYAAIMPAGTDGIVGGITVTQG